MSTSLNSYPFLIKHNRFIVYLINGNFLLQYILYIVSCSCTTLIASIFQRPQGSFACWFCRLIKCWARNRVQNYCFYLTWPNFWATFLHFLRNLLIFIITQKSGFQRALLDYGAKKLEHRSMVLLDWLGHALGEVVSFSKADAKLLLFSDMTKFLCTFLVFSS